MDIIKIINERGGLADRYLYFQILEYIFDLLMATLISCSTLLFEWFLFFVTATAEESASHK